MIKKIHINEKQEKILVREAMQGAFSFETIKQLPSFAQRVKYCKEHFGQVIGNGSSRICFQIDDTWILKLAKNPKGIAQNEEEGQEDYYRDSFMCTPKMNHELSDMDNFTFIVSEYILPAKLQDFVKCLGISFNTLCSFLQWTNRQYSRRGFFGGAMDDDTASDLIENNEAINDIYSYLSDYQKGVGDFLRLANWGMALRDGQPTMVILDNGLNDEIYNKFYRNNRIRENIKIHKGEKGKKMSTQGRLLIQENSIDRKVNNTIAKLTGVDDFNEIRRIRAEILNKIPNARAKNCKWLPRIIEMYLEGEIPQQDIKVFNNFLGDLHKREHLDGALLDNKFYDFSFDKLKGLYFNDKATQMLNAASTDKIQKVSNYTIYRIDNQDEANNMAYSIFNGEWCILDDLFDSQVDDCTCYIMKRDDYYNVHEMTVHEFNERCPHDTDLYEEFREELDEEDIDIYGNDLMDEFLIDSSTYCSTDDFVKECGIQPYDDYGYSAIVVLIGSDGKTYGVYSRYNMPNMQDGSFLDTNEISQLLGVDYRTVMPYVNHEETVTESIKIHKGEKGKKMSTQGKWADTIKCPHCEGDAFFSMSISDGNQGRGRIKVTDEQGIEKDSEVQTIALYYCPKCYRFIAQNNMA